MISTPAVEAGVIVAAGAPSGGDVRRRPGHVSPVFEEVRVVVSDPSAGEPARGGDSATTEWIKFHVDRMNNDDRVSADEGDDFE